MIFEHDAQRHDEIHRDDQLISFEFYARHLKRLLCKRRHSNTDRSSYRELGDLIAENIVSMLGAERASRRPRQIWSEMRAGKRELFAELLGRPSLIRPTLNLFLSST